jgi:hypothetical protein
VSSTRNPNNPQADDNPTLDRTEAWRSALAIAQKPKKQLAEYTPGEILDIFRKADVDNPSLEDLTELRTLLKQHPELWKISGDVAALAAKKIIDSLNARGSTKVSMEAGMAAIRAELGYEQAPMLEKLLIEHVAVCWLSMYLMEYHYTNSMNTKGGVALALGDYLERSLTMAQGRYLRAMETLARVRRLMKPVPVQVNIAGQGGQQINTVKP